MTDPANNPSPPTKALRVARALIALGLLAGVCVFAAFAINQLAAGITTYAPPRDFGASDAAPAQSPQNSSPLADLSATDTSKYIPILRPNPHPGQIPPFLGAAPYSQAPYQQPSDDGEIWEFCVYQVKDASLTDLLAYYNTQAQQRGMTLRKQKPTSVNMPGGIEAAWSDGQRTLQVTARPMPTTEPVAPPLAPPTPCRWVVKYSYPAKTNKP